MKKWFLLTSVLFILVISGCKKDTEEGIEVTEMMLAEKLENLDIPEILKNSENPNAQQVEMYFDQAMGIADNFDWFDIPEDAGRDGDDYYWSYGGLSLWETYYYFAPNLRILSEV